jgi:hypothetical protein
MLRDLLNREQKFRGEQIKCVTFHLNIPYTLLKCITSKLEIDEDDVALIFEDLHRGRSVIPPHAVPSRPVLIRWDSELQLTAENCVVMEHGDAEKHARECLGINMITSAGDEVATVRRPIDLWGEEVATLVERRAKEVMRQREWVM